MAKCRNGTPSRAARAHTVAKNTTPARRTTVVCAASCSARCVRASTICRRSSRKRRKSVRVCTEHSFETRDFCALSLAFLQFMMSFLVVFDLFQRLTKTRSLFQVECVQCKPNAMPCRRGSLQSLTHVRVIYDAFVALVLVNKLCTTLSFVCGIFSLYVWYYNCRNKCRSCARMFRLS